MGRRVVTIWLAAAVAGVAVAAGQPPATRMGEPWGMIYGGSGFPGGETREEEARAVAERAAEFRRWGVQATRLGVCWCNVERERGVYDWSEPDAQLIPPAEAGLTIFLCVATTPEWSWQYPEAAAILRRRGQDNLAGCLPHDPRYWPDYERYLAAMVQRYKPYLRHYEIWNEPDGMAGFRFVKDATGTVIDVHYGGDPEWYAELVKRSARVIRAEQPEARIAIGSFENKSPDNTKFLEGLYARDISPHHDAISVHPYGEPFNRRWLATVREFMVRHGDADKGVWVNEYSYAGRGVDLAFDVRRKLRLLRETPWIGMAEPLVFAVHFDETISPQGWSRRAHKQMTEEYEPRASFAADFEGPVVRLLDRWEWMVSGEGNIDGPEISNDFPHGGDACLAAKTDGRSLRVWFSPYVRGSETVIAGALLVEPAVADATLALSFGVESGDILQEIREERADRDDLPRREWFSFEFPAAERIPEWRELPLVTCYVQVDCGAPGLRVSVDDVYVGPTRDRRQERGETEP